MSSALTEGTQKECGELDEGYELPLDASLSADTSPPWTASSPDFGPEVMFDRLTELAIIATSPESPLLRASPPLLGPPSTVSAPQESPLCVRRTPHSGTRLGRAHSASRPARTAEVVPKRQRTTSQEPACHAVGHRNPTACGCRSFRRPVSPLCCSSPESELWQNGRLPQLPSPL